ncbi:polyprenyl synthetase family protein [Microbacterium sp. LRZ72]|uniref:polyprenyl synthetase family protein n=1 Tax=Microbacterium sp. LRZ72 TaxID=2942481 RepID=UPI0029A9647B|nr:polyprenyl synthetase family protein [Microbacterium sp. LRZ72]MDX2377162.1 polyprenyl synthetase family protein [Microbacterium sp. LRZ72]
MQGSPDAIRAVSQRLESFFDDRADENRDLGAAAEPILRAAREALTGGKRLRAQFCLTGWRAVASAGRPADDPPAAVVSAASALEVFHAAALVHDDIIDNSDTRRGRPSAHRALQAQHREADWAGDAQAYGRSAAILLGDLLVAWSDDLLEEGAADCAPGPASAARERYARMRRDVTLGQYLDVAAEASHVQVPDDEQLHRALQVASFKSARYSVQQPLLIGAALAGATPEQDAALAAFGHPLGMAFQLRDDVLGVFGDSAVTGKPAGDDLREGKRTALIALARPMLPPPLRRTLDELLGDPTLESGQIEAMQGALRDCGALERVEQLIADYAHEADRALAGAPLGHQAVGALRDLAERAVSRTA